jgi:RNA polymerase sigma-70 factor (ECF subfamily)
MAVMDPSHDPDSAEWVRSLTATGIEHEAAVERLFDLLVPVARSAARRRLGAIGVDGPELEDLAHQAAADAVLAITRKLALFRGESRFTTWAYKFVILEVASKAGRHFWRHPGASLGAEQWERLPDRFGLDPARQSEWRDLVDALKRAVDQELSDRQRRIFVALVLDGIPLDALVAELGSTRNAIYKSLFDARRKLRARLVDLGHLEA